MEGELKDGCRGHGTAAVSSAVQVAAGVAVGDKIKQVFQAGLELLDTALGSYASSKDLGSREVGAMLETALPELLSKCGDMTARTRDAARTAVMELALKPTVQPSGAVPRAALRPMKAKVQWREAEGRLAVLETLIAELGLEAPLSLDAVMRFVAPNFKHMKKEVRDAAVKVTVAVHDIVGPAVNDHLQLGEHDGPMRKTVAEALGGGAGVKKAAPRKPALPAAARKVGEGGLMGSGTRV